MKSKNGFTLIELIVVIAILAIVAAVAVPTAFGSLDNARVTAATSTIKNIVSYQGVLDAELMLDNTLDNYNIKNAIIMHYNGTKWVDSTPKKEYPALNKYYIDGYTASGLAPAGTVTIMFLRSNGKTSISSFFYTPDDGSGIYEYNNGTITRHK